MMSGIIPKDFYSFEKGGLFQNCVHCDKYLLDPDTEYLIEKAYKAYEGYSAKDVIFDYAICLECARKMQESISEDSLNHIVSYFNQHVEGKPSNTGRQNYLDRCLIKDTPIENCTEYQIYAYCKGRQLSSHHQPYMISGEVIEELMPGLSASTKDEMDHFFNEFIKPDPGFFQPTPKLILL